MLVQLGLYYVARNADFWRRALAVAKSDMTAPEPAREERARACFERMRWWENTEKSMLSDGLRGVVIVEPPFA